MTKKQKSVVSATEEQTLHCSFCDKSQNQIKKLISSPANGRSKAFICDECVAVCNSVLVDDDGSIREALNSLANLNLRPPHNYEPKGALRIFYSYSHRDEVLRNRIEEHLSTLKWEGLIRSWHDRKIEAGQEWDTVIDDQLRNADIVLLLVSASFLASNYCYGREATFALERHKKGECRVIPIILKPADWHHTPLANLQALPRDGKPITNWHNREQAFLNVVQEIRKVIGGTHPNK